MAVKNKLKIGTSSVRGVIGEGLTPELVVDFACAFGTWTEGSPVVIGNDSRYSAPLLRSAVISGLLSPGCEVIDLGLASTPQVSFYVREFGCAGGISITGSHNEAEWNALKFIGPDGTLLNAAKNEELLDIYHASNFLTAPREKFNLLTPGEDIIQRYIEYIISGLEISAIRDRGFRVAVDFCNGVCYGIASRLLSELGCELQAVNERPVGRFAHSPAPSIPNMKQLADFVKEHQSDLGASLNIDGDRIGFVTHNGRALSEELTIALAVKSRLSRREGPIVTNLSTSKSIDRLAEQFNQKIIRTAVGESHVIDRGIEEGAILAGEGSGGVAAMPVAMTFDALLTLGLILEYLAVSEETLEQMAQEVPAYSMKKGVLSAPPAVVYKTVDHFRKNYLEYKPDFTDGVRVELEDSWFHIRASSTEQILRVVVEASEEDSANQLFETIMSEAAEMMQRG